METEREVEQSLPKVGARCLPQGRLSEVSGLLAAACLFTAAGGYMDAFSYLAHGHVFANSQTGNFVFFAVFASRGHWVRAGRHLPPFVAFALGVVLWNAGRETAESRRKATSLGWYVAHFLQARSAEAATPDSIWSMSLYPV
jgi:uncharacterized membrane protein YoaK (UPF0700 family)